MYKVLFKSVHEKMHVFTNRLYDLKFLNSRKNHKKKTIFWNDFLLVKMCFPQSVPIQKFIFFLFAKTLFPGIYKQNIIIPLVLYLWFMGIFMVFLIGHQRSKDTDMSFWDFEHGLGQTLDTRVRPSLSKTRKNRKFSTKLIKFQHHK